MASQRTEVAQNEIRKPKDAIILPIMVVIRQPYLLARAETTGPENKSKCHAKDEGRKKRCDQVEKTCVPVSRDPIQIGLRGEKKKNCPS